MEDNRTFVKSISEFSSKSKAAQIGGTPKIERKRGTSHARVIEKEMVLPPTMRGVEEASQNTEKIGNLLQQKSTMSAFGLPPRSKMTQFEKTMKGFEVASQQSKSSQHRGKSSTVATKEKKTGESAVNNEM